MKLLLTFEHVAASRCFLCTSWLLHLLVVRCRAGTEGEQTGQRVQIQRWQWERSHVLWRPERPPAAETCRNLCTTCTAVCVTQNCRRWATTCALQLRKPVVGVVRNVASFHLNHTSGCLPLSNFSSSPFVSFFFLLGSAALWYLFLQHIRYTYISNYSEIIKEAESLECSRSQWTNHNRCEAAVQYCTEPARLYGRLQILIIAGGDGEARGSSSQTSQRNALSAQEQAYLNFTGTAKQKSHRHRSDWLAD